MRGNDTGLYVLVAISQIAAIIYAIVTGINSIWIFIPLAIGFIYMLVMKIFGVVLALRATSNVNMNDIEKIKEILSK